MIYPLPGKYGTEILRSEVGSTLHGTGLEGNEDHDEMGIFIEPVNSCTGLINNETNHYVFRTAEKGSRSTPKDTDLVCYSLRKWAGLAVQGNPSVLLLLFAPEEKLMVQTDLGNELRWIRDYFWSKRAGKAFLGYMERQRQRIIGERGSAGRIRRGEDGEVDWKYAMHMLRLGHQGVEYLSTGHLTLPIEPERGDFLREVRQGHVSLEEVIEHGSELEKLLTITLESNEKVPEHPDYDKIQKWMVSAHLRQWQLARYEK